MLIEQLDPVWAKVSGEGEDMIKLLTFTTYEETFYRQGPFKKTRQIRKKNIVDKRGLFFAGFIPRIVLFCQQQQLSFEVKNTKTFLFDRVPYKGHERFTLREDQTYLVDQAMQHQRGVLVAPTGSGKTIIACAIIHQLPKFKVAFLCHTKTLVNQTRKEMTEWGFHTSLCSEGTKDLSGNIVVGTIQSFSRLTPEEYCTMFDMVIIDEAHHVSSFTGQYATVLSRMYTPTRFGLTATPINASGGIPLAMEGLLGPVVGEIDLNYGIQENILAEPCIKLLVVPKSPVLENLSRYADIYSKGVVEYRRRNNVILTEALQLHKAGKTTLILVNKIHHGELLQVLAEAKGLPAVFLHGASPGEVREATRETFKKKEIPCVIATTVWKEGVNIPSLDCVINAAGGKSEIAVLQSIGRGLRRTKDKEQVIIVDIVDQGKYLSEHFAQRLSLYLENNWPIFYDRH